MEIRLNSISKCFGPVRALGTLSMAFAPGLTHVILGASGCGKSTLLRIIAGISPPDEGEILIGKTRQDRVSHRLLAERMGYVVQEGGLFPHLTVRDNVSLKAVLLGWDSEKILLRLTALANLVGLCESLLCRYPAELSGGQRQRVSLMRALMLDPPVLLLDEPLGALDPMVRRSLQTELHVIFKNLKKTVIFVTHDLAEAMFISDTVTLLHHGKIVQHGSFNDLSESPAHPFVSEFFRAQRPWERVREAA